MISFEGKTIKQVLDEIGQEFQQLSPERQEAGRKELYERLTGQPYPPPTASTVDGESGMTVEDAKRLLNEAAEAEHDHPPLTAPRRKPEKK